MDVGLREKVRLRAAGECEYCRIHEDDEPTLRHHMDHIVPQQHGGTKDLANLAWACPWCNRHKGPNLSGIDPVSGHMTRLFHPRRDTWIDHFRINGPLFEGLTDVGRTTIAVLQINDLMRVELRRVLLRLRGRLH